MSSDTFLLPRGRGVARRICSLHVRRNNRKLPKSRRDGALIMSSDTFLGGEELGFFAVFADLVYGEDLVVDY